LALPLNVILTLSGVEWGRTPAFAFAFAFVVAVALAVAGSEQGRMGKNIRICAFAVVCSSPPANNPRVPHPSRTLRWMGYKPSPGHKASVVALAFVCSCRHPERSEGSRSISPTPAVRILLPLRLLTRIRTIGEGTTKPKNRTMAPERISIYFFAIFRPKIACQAPKPPNPHKPNNIRVAF
jgi:hypothetical protein